MIKNFSLSSLLILSNLVIAPGVAMADPIGYGITIVCPGTQGSQNTITNFGSHIGGYGVEYIMNQTPQIYFRSTGSVQDVPANLVNYSNQSTTYNSASGNVMCSYQSNNPTDPVFSIAYNITNGFGGSVQSQSNNSITIILPAGLMG